MKKKLKEDKQKPHNNNVRATCQSKTLPGCWITMNGVRGICYSGRLKTLACASYQCGEKGTRSWRSVVQPTSLPKSASNFSITHMQSLKLDAPPDSLGKAWFPACLIVSAITARRLRDAARWLVEASAQEKTEQGCTRAQEDTHV